MEGEDNILDGFKAEATEELREWLDDAGYDALRRAGTENDAGQMLFEAMVEIANEVTVTGDAWTVETVIDFLSANRFLAYGRVRGITQADAEPNRELTELVEELVSEEIYQHLRNELDALGTLGPGILSAVDRWELARTALFDAHCRSLIS